MNDLPEVDARFEEISKIVHDLMGRACPDCDEMIMDTYEACAIGDLLKYAARLRAAAMAEKP